MTPAGTSPADPDFATTWPPHCRAGTAGADFHPDLDATHIDEVFRKGAHAAAYSGFEGRAGSGQPLADWLRERGVTAMDVAGIATDYCVRATAADAVGAGFATRLLLGLTAGVAPATTEAAVAELRGLGVEISGLDPSQQRVGGRIGNAAEVALQHLPERWQTGISPAEGG